MPYSHLTGGFGNAPPLTWLPAAQPWAQPEPRVTAAQEASLGDTFSSQGRLEQALERYIAAARLDPGDARYHLKLGLAAWQLRRMELARPHLQQAVRLMPENAAALRFVAEFAYDDGQMEQALALSERALRLAPRDFDTIVSRAQILQLDCQSEEAWRLLEPLIRSRARTCRIAEIYSALAPKIGRETQALEYVLELLGTAAAGMEQAKLHFAASALLDRMGRYDEAFEHARLGKQAAMRPYDPQRMTQWTDFQIGYFTPAKLHDLPRASHGNRRPVFIVGMPRSGTTLVEQILASHPQVHGAGELMLVGELARGERQSDWMGSEIFPACLDALSLRKANQLAQTYLSAIAAIGGTATYVTDKMPQNFLYLGLITLLFPDCHVIHCTRDPRDTCLSCFMNLFEFGQAFTHDLTHLGRFYRDYRRLMAHWQSTLNISMIEVNYETLVGDLEGQTRRLLEALNLPWDDRCLRFHENRRQVRTASWEQVRRPLYASSVGRWKHYQRHLWPLLESLGDLAGT